MAMDLLDRYLQAVKFWLPKAQQDDIAQELSEEIHSQIAEKEADLGRPLAEPELAAIIKNYGDPITVAGRYLPEESGNPIFSLLYRFSLKAILGWILAPIFLLALIGAALTPENPGPAIVRVLGDSWRTAMYTIGIITLAFAVLKRALRQVRWESHWDPRKLPRLAAGRGVQRIPRGTSVFELVWDAVFILWWVNLLHLPQVPGVRISPAPAIAHDFFWPVLMLALCTAALTSVNIIRHWWTPLRSSFRLAIDCAGLVLVLLALKAGPWVNVVAADPAGSDALSKSVNAGIQITLGITALIAAFAIFEDVRRLIRRRPHLPSRESIACS